MPNDPKNDSTQEVNTSGTIEEKSTGTVSENPLNTRALLYTNYLSSTPVTDLVPAPTSPSTFPNTPQSSINIPPSNRQERDNTPNPSSTSLETSEVAVPSNIYLDLIVKEDLKVGIEAGFRLPTPITINTLHNGEGSLETNSAISFNSKTTPLELSLAESSSSSFRDSDGSTTNQTFSKTVGIQNEGLVAGASFSTSYVNPQGFPVSSNTLSLGISPAGPLGGIGHTTFRTNPESGRLEYAGNQPRKEFGLGLNYNPTSGIGAQLALSISDTTTLELAMGGSIPVLGILPLPTTFLVGLGRSPEGFLNREFYTTFEKDPKTGLINAVEVHLGWKDSTSANLQIGLVGGVVPWVNYSHEGNEKIIIRDTSALNWLNYASQPVSQFWREQQALFDLSKRLGIGPETFSKFEKLPLLLKDNPNALGELGHTQESLQAAHDIQKTAIVQYLNSQKPLIAQLLGTQLSAPDFPVKFDNLVAAILYSLPYRVAAPESLNWGSEEAIKKLLKNPLNQSVTESFPHGFDIDARLESQIVPSDNAIHPTTRRFIPQFQVHGMEYLDGREMEDSFVGWKKIPNSESSFFSAKPFDFPIYPGFNPILLLSGGPNISNSLNQTVKTLALDPTFGKDFIKILHKAGMNDPNWFQDFSDLTRSSSSNPTFQANLQSLFVQLFDNQQLSKNIINNRLNPLSETLIQSSEEKFSGALRKHLERASKNDPSDFSTNINDLNTTINSQAPEIRSLLLKRAGELFRDVAYSGAYGELFNSMISSKDLITQIIADESTKVVAELRELNPGEPLPHTRFLSEALIQTNLRLKTPQERQSRFRYGKVTDSTFLQQP